MSRFNNINGTLVQYTQAQEDAADAQAQAYEDNKFTKHLNRLRVKRNRLLAETDFYALSDVTMSEDMTNYRQALRDLPSGLDTVDKVNNKVYPTKP